jgi:hypothetical protein
MQLWFPSSTSSHALGGDLYAHRAVDPELEFDPEVYPIGISLAEVSIIGRLCLLRLVLVFVTTVWGGTLHIGMSWKATFCRAGQSLSWH